MELGVSPDQLRDAISKALDLICIYDVSCENLKKSDLMSNSDPYVVFMIGEKGASFDEKSKRAAIDLKQAVIQTPVKDNTLNPTYYKWSAYLRKDSVLERPEIHVRVLDSDGEGKTTFFKDDVLGEATVALSSAVKGEHCELPLNGGTGVVRFKFLGTCDALRNSELAEDEVAKSKIVQKTAVVGLDEKFKMKDAAKMCELANLVYFSKAGWASKKDGFGCTYDPEKMSVPLRYKIGDLVRQKLLPESPFQVETLDKEYDQDLGSAKFKNGVIHDAKFDQQAMVLLDKANKRVIVSFRGTDVKDLNR